ALRRQGQLLDTYSGTEARRAATDDDHVERHRLARAEPFGNGLVVHTASGQLFSELRNDLEQVSHEPDIRDFEYRRGSVGIDRNDSPRVLDASQMRDRTRYPDCDIKIWRDDLARLSDLHFVRHITCIDSGTGRPHSSPHRIGEPVNDLETL